MHILSFIDGIQLADIRRAYLIFRKDIVAVIEEKCFALCPSLRKQRILKRCFAVRLLLKTIVIPDDTHLITVKRRFNGVDISD